MNRYFFDMFDGQVHRDEEGSVFPRPEDACKEARVALPEIAMGTLRGDGDDKAFRMIVRDCMGHIIYTANLTYNGTASF